MEKVQELLKDMNDDIERRLNGLETNPFEKQGKVAELYPQVVIKHPECFCLDRIYYPENTRDRIDVQNIEIVRSRIEEIKKDNSYTPDMSMKKVA